MLETTTVVPQTGSGLRVVHISPARGGVANAARRLHQGLLKIGVNSKLFTSQAKSEDAAQQVYGFPPAKRWTVSADKVAKLAYKRLGLLGMINTSSLFWSFPDADIIHLHGADTDWFNLHALKRLARHHVLVWTMHDKHLATGACGYPENWGCERWKTGCGHCPKQQEDGWWLDLSRPVFSRKRAILSQVQMAVVAPNQWMYDFIAASPITGHQALGRIPYGIDTDAFTPYPLQEARRELGLPPDASLLLSVATKLGQARKGLQYYPALLKHLRERDPDKNLGLILAGDELPEDKLAELRNYIPVYPLGHIDSPEKLAKVYSAADCFVILSTIDNFPNVVLESLACGTPAAGFAVGGIPDMIQPGQTGILAGLGDTEAMAAGISDLLNHPAELEKMRVNCRKEAVENFSLTVQARRYMDFYRERMAETQRTTS
jgi:glycosyltransferase involved in cell wall biosynthesis